MVPDEKGSAASLADGLSSMRGPASGKVVRTAQMNIQQMRRCCGTVLAYEEKVAP
jgi:hypothetical protein